MELKGTTTDWEGLEKAKQERWHKTHLGLTHCSKHGTFFDPDGTDAHEGQDAEPCWLCVKEFEKEL